MKYTTDDAHREIISRAHKLNPDAFNSHSGKSRGENVEAQRVEAIQAAAADFYAEGNEIVGEDEFNEERSAR